MIGSLRQCLQRKRVEVLRHANSGWALRSRGRMKRIIGDVAQAQRAAAALPLQSMNYLGGWKHDLRGFWMQNGQTGGCAVGIPTEILSFNPSSPAPVNC
jgi:hypothetical protein